MKSFTVENNLQNNGVEVISIADANFNNELAKYIGNHKEVLPLVEAAKPFALFIKNNSSKDIAAVSLRWTLTKQNGETLVASQIASNPGVLMGMKPRDPWMIGKTSLINSKATRFFTYFNGVEQEIVNINMAVRNPTINYNSSTSDYHRQILSFTQSQSSNIQKDVVGVSVAVDGIIFNDGNFVGEDKNLYVDSLNGQIRARKDFVKSLREAKALNKESSETLANFLANPATQGLNDLDAQSNADYKNSDDAFRQNYKSYMESLKEEVSKKRGKASDDVIVNDFLLAQDSDFIEVRKVSK